MSDLLAKLKSNDPDLRLQGILASEGLSAPVDAEILSALESIIRDRDIHADNRDAAAKALGKIDDSTARSRLQELARSELPELRSFGALGFGNWNSSESVTILIEMLKDPVNSVRNQAERSLILLREAVCQSGVPLLLELLQHPVPLSRSPAARLLGLTEDRRAFEPLCQMLKSDEEWLGRMWAAKALGDLGQLDAATALADRLFHDDKNRVRAAAAQALGDLRPPEAREILEKAMNDPDPGVQKAVGEALESLNIAGDKTTAEE